MMDRRIALSGPLNFRDPGDHDTADVRRVRCLRLFRSDSLSPVTADDARLLTEDLGLLAVVDLRTGREVQRDGRGGLADVALHYPHVPLLEDDDLSEAPSARPFDRSLHEAYTHLLGHCAGRISEAL